MRRIPASIIATALLSAAALPALTPPVSAASHPTASAVIVDGVGIIPTHSKHYTRVVHLGQPVAFVDIYHTTYTGKLSAHISVDRHSHTIMRAMMAPARQGRRFFYVWVRFRDRTQVGPLVAYLTIQTSSGRVMRELPFTLER